MKRIRPFRFWFYFRQGWALYFAFIFSAINTMVVTYYLAIERIPPLKEIFPTFSLYFLAFASVGIPLLVLIGYVHYKRVAAYSSEMDITVESNPYQYKLPSKGWNQLVTFPLNLMLSEFLIKWSKGEKLSQKEINELTELQEKIKFLINGGSLQQKKGLPEL